MGRPDLRLVWFKRDLRVADHPPLAAAAASGDPVVGLVVLEPSLLHRPVDDPARTAVQLDAVADLRERLAALGVPLLVRHAEAVDALSEVDRAVRVAAIHAHEETSDLDGWARDRRVRGWARERGIAVHEVPTDGVVRGPHDRDRWAAGLEAHLRADPPPVPRAVRGLDLDAVGLDAGPVPSPADLGLDATGPRATDRPEITRATGEATLRSFVTDRARGYERAISSPLTAWDGGSRLSVHLAMGTLSLREVARATRAGIGRASRRDPDLAGSLRTFEERLAWRSHFVQKLEDEPDLERRSFVAAYDELRSDEHPAHREAWATGTTGYPMVDASMRMLEATGWLNFRMRSMLVSFAGYHLWLPWQGTGTHLASRFLDYEPGVHWSQTQMQSGTTGMNRLRVYDPVKQQADHDPTGAFVRRWVPELRDVADEHLLAPWRAPTPPAGYRTPPVVDASAARLARERIERLRRDPAVRAATRDVVDRHGSRRPSPDRRRGSARRGRPR